MNEILSDEQKAQIQESLDATTFSLTDFLDRKWTFPSFTTTVYLDGATASKISGLDQKIYDLKGRMEKAQRSAKENSPGTLGAPAESAEVVEYRHRLEELEAERKRLTEVFRASALKVVFRQQFPSNELYKRATAKAKDAFPKLSEEQIDKDPEAAEYKGRYVMLYTLEGIYDYQGKQPAEELTIEHVRVLMDRLVPSERQKLDRHMMMALTGGDVMQRAADAGFPG